MRGFSFPETLVVIAVTGIIGIAINSMIVNFYRQNAYLLQQTAATDNARRGLGTTFTALRESSYGDDGSYPIQNVSTSSITFFSDIDTDGGIEKIRFYVSGETLYRGITESTSTPPTYSGQPEIPTVIAEHVRNGTSTPLFRYYDVNGDELSAPVPIADVASIGTSLMIDLNPFRAPDILTLQETATLRNLR